MQNITLDKNYELVEEKSIYHDDLIESIDLIKKARAGNKISQAEETMLLNLALRNELKKQAGNIRSFLNQAPLIASFFTKMKAKQVTYAS